MLAAPSPVPDEHSPKPKKRRYVKTGAFSLKRPDSLPVRADRGIGRRFMSAEHFVRSIVGGAPTMLGALAEQGPGVLDVIVAEVVEATRAYVDGDGWATAQVTNIITAVA